MATFQVQVEGLTSLSVGTTPTTAELAEFLKDGVIDVTNRWLAIKPQDIEDFVRGSSTQSSNGFATSGANIVSVIREAGADGDTDGSTAWEPCRKVPSSMRSRVVDVDSLSYASKYNPVYIINNNSAVNVYPVPDGTNDGYRVYYVNNEPKGDGIVDELAAGHSTIGYFPKDKVYLVVLYASMRSLQANMGATTITDLSVTAVPPDVPTLSSSAVSFSQSAPTYTSPTTTISGVAWATEYPAAEVDITTPLAAIVTNIDLANAIIDSPPVPPDNASAFSLGGEFDDAMAKAKALIDDAGSLTQGDDAEAHLASEDSELVASTVQIASQELQRANLGLQDATQTFSSGLGKFSAEVQAYQTEIGEMSARAQGYIQAAQGYANEVKTRLSATQTKIAEYQSRVQDALNEFNEANAVYQAQLQLSFKNADFDNQEDARLVQKYQAEYAGYTAEVGAQVQEYTQNLQADGVGYQWLQDQYTRLKAEYDAAFMIVAPKPQPQQQVRR
jgi:hypothetical protein